VRLYPKRALSPGEKSQHFSVHSPGRAVSSLGQFPLFVLFLVAFKRLDKSLPTIPIPKLVTVDIHYIEIQTYRVFSRVIIHGDSGFAEVVLFEIDRGEKIIQIHFNGTHFKAGGIQIDGKRLFLRRG
jgi:hypothetical protein